MKIQRSAVSGTLESCDLMVSVDPLEQGLEVEVESVVLNRFGDHILEVVRDTLSQMKVDGAHVRIDDRGALDCTIRARLQSALYRAGECPEVIPWRELI